MSVSEYGGGASSGTLPGMLAVQCRWAVDVSCLVVLVDAGKRPVYPNIAHDNKSEEFSFDISKYD
jgi:hypothetical protein